MNKQDRQGVRTAADLERKYDLAALVGIKKAAKQNEAGLTKTNKTLEEFMKATLGTLENMQTQIDGNITTYFYSGVPTLENLPASEWSLNETRDEHLGDLYYDKKTGQAYEFQVVDGSYCWTETKTTATIEALALANAAKDTADGKRRVFLETPSPPYDNGDLWFCEQEIYICQISKATGEDYVENDFIIATRYTDDTLASQVGDELEIIRGTVTKIQEGVDAVRIDIETTTKSIDELKQETTEAIERMSYEFGTENFTIEKAGSEMKTQISEDGMKVYKDGEKMLDANNTGVDAVNLHAKTYLIIGKNSRFEDFNGNRTGCFWIGGDA